MAIIQVLIYSVSLTFTLTFARVAHSISGTYFVIPYPDHQHPLQNSILVSTFEEQVNVDFILFDKNCRYIVKPKRTISFPLYHKLYQTVGNGVFTAVAIHTNGAVRVYSTLVSEDPSIRETFSLLPKESSFHSYHVSAPKGYPFINVLSFDDANTILTVKFPTDDHIKHFSVDCGANFVCEAGKTVTVKMPEPHSVWHFALKGIDYILQNTHISSNNRIYVIAGSIGCHNGYDLCVTNTQPDNIWGKTYVIPESTLSTTDFYFRFNALEFPIKLDLHENEKMIRALKVEEANPMIEVKDVMGMLVITADKPFGLYQEFRSRVIDTPPPGPTTEKEVKTPGETNTTKQSNGKTDKNETKTNDSKTKTNNEAATGETQEGEVEGEKRHRRAIADHGIFVDPDQSYRGMGHERTEYENQDKKYTRNRHSESDKAGLKLMEYNEDSSLLSIVPVEQWMHGLYYSFPKPTEKISFKTSYYMVLVNVPPKDVKILDLTVPIIWTNTSSMKVAGVMYYSGVVSLPIDGAARIFTSNPAGRMMMYGRALIHDGDKPLTSVSFPFDFYQGEIYQEHCKKQTDFGPSDGVDNDCDGFIDEEVENGLDDDNDGKIDEDFVEHNSDGTWSKWKFQCGVMCHESNTTIRTRMCESQSGYGSLCSGDSLQCNERPCPSYCHSGSRMYTDCFCSVCKTCKLGFFICDACKPGIRPSLHCTTPCPRGWAGVGCIDSVPVKKLYIGSNTGLGGPGGTSIVFIVVATVAVGLLIVFLVFRRRRQQRRHKTEGDWGEYFVHPHASTEDVTVTAECESLSHEDTFVSAHLSDKALGD